jgi:hypothetical protein
MRPEGKETTQSQEKSFELRSEKVRSIIGAVPSSLLRFGTLAITITLLLLFLLVWFLPYKRSYTALCCLQEVTIPITHTCDSIDVLMRIRFTQERPHTKLQFPVIEFQNGEERFRGKLLALSELRDTLGGQNAKARITYDTYQRLYGYEVEIILIEQTRLRHLIWR